MVMLLAHAHAHVLAEARSCLAALADGATTFDLSVAYERLLLCLDWLHGDDTPACEPMPGVGSDELLRRAEAAIEHLVEFGVDALSIELLLADQSLRVGHRHAVHIPAPRSRAWSSTCV